MKTSYILLAIVAILTLTGMVATDVLLKQQYDKMDWRNPYQNFDKRSLPTVRHWVIEGTPNDEIVVLESIDKPQALIAPDYAKFYRMEQREDTVLVQFVPDYSGNRSEPRSAADRELSVQLVLRLPELQTLWIKDGRVTLSELKKDRLQITLQNSRLRTAGVGSLDSCSLIAGQNSFAVFGPTDRYGVLKAVVQDSSGIQLNNTLVENFTVQTSAKAEVRLQGQALKWLK